MSKIILHDLETAAPLGWLQSFDLDANEGRGFVGITQVESEAMVFPDFRAAFETWRKTSEKYPVRPDGKPNRPLTAYTAEIK